MATEGLRKHTTTLFNGVLAGQVPQWSGSLINHTNLSNHQVCITAAQEPTGGVYAIYLLTEAGGNQPVDTGLVLDMTGVNSAVVTFTGILSGILLKAIELIPETEIKVSAVISSFSRVKEAGLEIASKERLDYVSTDLGTMQNAQQNFSKNVSNHSNMIYHQLVVTSNEQTSDAYKVRFIPDTEGEVLEASVDTGRLLQFDNNNSAIVRFGGVIKGIHLEAEGAVLNSGEFRVVLSSAVERFDEIVYDYIGVAPELGDHVTDLNNPHQTSWDNLFGKPSVFANKEVLPEGDTAVVPPDHQLLIWEEYHVKGTLDVSGRLVILHDRPEARAIAPDFTYNLNGDLTQIDYGAGEQKLFSYNVSDQLEQVDIKRDGTTLRKTFYYTGGGELDYVTEQWL